MNNNNYYYRVPYQNNFKTYTSNNTYPTTRNNDRFFLGPFLVGGLAGTALGYGIANNNHNFGYYYRPPIYYYPAQNYPPIYYNNYYY